MNILSRETLLINQLNFTIKHSLDREYLISEK